MRGVAVSWRERIRAWTYSVGVAPFPSILLPAALSSTPRAPVVVFLDGAEGLGYDNAVRSGLRQAGWRGNFDNHRWSTHLVMTDHLVLARSKIPAIGLADKLE